MTTTRRNVALVMTGVGISIGSFNDKSRGISFCISAPNFVPIFLPGRSTPMVAVWRGGCV